jgi:hypothetical protein
MGCSSCGGAAKNSAKYPYEAVMPDGTKVLVSSAAQERAERDAARARMRSAARGNGYTVQDA